MIMKLFEKPNCIGVKQLLSDPQVNWQMEQLLLYLLMKLDSSKIDNTGFFLELVHNTAQNCLYNKNTQVYIRYQDNLFNNKTKTAQIFN